MSAYQKYFAAKAAAERWESEMIEDLRECGERYLELQADLREARGQSRYFMDGHFPVSVDDVEDYGDTIRVRGHWTRRGCTDKENCDLPRALVFGTPEEREAIYADLQQQIAAAKAERERQAEAKRFAEYEKLKAEFGK